MTLKFALVVVGLALLALGAHGLYYASRNQAQTAITCEQFSRQRPSAVWVRLTGCELDYVGAGYREVRGRIAELYFPVRAAGSDSSAPVALVAVTRDPQALAIAQETIGAGRQADQEGFLVMMLRIVTSLKASREVQGTIRTSPLQMLSTRRALAGMGAPLAPGAAVMDLYARPTLLWPAVQVGGGLIALLLFVFLGRSRREAAAAPLEAKRLPALMLLNLPQEAGAAEIERAPALGSRKEVVKRVRRAVKGVRFKAERGVLKTRTFELTIDLGAGDIVATAVVHARGEASAEALAALLRETGWRAYVPKRGAFVAPEQIDEIAAP